MKKKWKRLGALTVAAALTLSLLPGTAFAATVSEPDNPVEVSEMTVSAGSVYSPGDSNEGPVSYATDRNDQTHWHTNWDSSDGSDASKRWIQIDLNTAQVLDKFAYYPRVYNGTNGYVTAYKVQVCPDETMSNTSSWITVSEGDGWDNSAGWKYASFDWPVYTKHVRLYGVHTTANNGNDAHMTAAEVGLSKATDQDHSRIVSGTVKDQKGAVVSDAVVIIGGQCTLTGSDGSFTVENLIPSTAYTASAAKRDYIEGTASVAADATSGVEITLQGLERIVSGTVTDGVGNPLAGAAVTLVGTAANHYPRVTQAEAVTTGSDGTYTLNVNSVPGGTYSIRVFKQDRGAKIITDTFQIQGTEFTETITGKNADLPAYPTYETEGYDVKFIDFSDGDAIALEKLAGANATVTPTIENEVLTLTYSGSNTAERNKNFVLIGGTPMKNGEIEFDATRTNGDKRFGLTFRMSDTGHMIYVGQFNGSSAWGHEHWNGDGKNVWSPAYSTNAPAFGPGDTCHFKVRINGEQVSLWVDGVTVYEDKYVSKADGSSSDSAKTPVMEAGSVGFSYGGTDGTLGGSGTANEVITIDNLRIVRYDPSFAVNWTAGTNGTITAKNTGDGSEDKALTSGGKAAEGDKIVISGQGDTGYALDSIQVTKVGDSTVTVETVKNEDGTITFAMPGYAVNVAPTFKLAVTGVSIEGTAKVGKTLSAKVQPVDATVSYQWIRETAGGSDVNVGTGESYTLVAGDQGKTVKVRVTGTGDYTGTAVSTSTGTVAAADIEVTSVALNHTAATLWTNKTGENTLSLTATVDPNNATSPSYQWTTSNSTVATVSGTDGTATVTAVGNGSATITVTVTSADGTERTATCDVTVKTAVTGITVKKDGTAVGITPIVIYTNDNDPSLTHSLELNAEVAPADASAVTLNWNRNPVQGIVTLVRDSQDSAHATITADTNKVNVGRVTVTVAVAEGGESGAEATFTVEVRTKLTNNVTITGTPKFGETLQVNLNQLQITDAGKNALTYQWKRGGTAISGATGDSYTLKQEDIGAVISVDVTADESTYYEGTRSASITGTVEKADGPAAPTGLAGVDCTTDDNNDGKITGLTSGTDYEISKDGGAWTDATVSAGGEIENLEPGSYKVRVKGTQTQKEGQESTSITILENGANAHSITIDSDIQHGTVSTVRSKADEGVTITISVTPDQGYQLVDGSLTVTKASGGTVTVSASNEFEMPGEDVTISAEFEILTFTITHDLHDLTCSLSESDVDHEHTVEYGYQTAITITPKEGYLVPTTVTVSKTGTPGDLGDTFYTYRYDTDRASATINFVNGITQDLTISATAELKKYTVRYSLTNGLSGPADRELSHGDSYSGAIVASEGYALPETVTVTMKGESLTEGTDYTYDPESGTVAFAAGKITGDVIVTAAGVRLTTELTNVSISGDVTVGRTLSATVSPAGATANYQWYRAGTAISGATQASYTLTQEDLGKVITVKATGSGEFSGEVTSLPTSAVAAATILPTAVTLDKTSATVKVGQKLVLTASITPDTATDKSLTWKVYEEHEQVESQGIATVAAGANGTATVTGLSEGKVRINAETANGLTVNCTLTVEPADPDAITATAEDVTADYDGQAHSVTVTVSHPESGATVTYSDAEAGEYTGTNPTYTAVGEYTTYYKVTAPGMSAVTGSARVVIRKAAPAVTLTVDQATLTNGGQVLLTVGVPAYAEAGTVTVSCDDPNVQATKGEDGRYAAQLPAGEKTYTFTAVLAGTENYGEAKATVSVHVSSGSSSGGSSSSSSSNREPSSNTTTTTERNKDGSVTTTVTDKRTGTVTVTTQKPDGTIEVKEIKKDGTKTQTVTTPEGRELQTVKEPNGVVTTTDTAANGTKVETVTKPGRDVTVKVTLPKNVDKETVSVPTSRSLSVSTVAKNTKTGEWIVLSVPTESGMLIQVEDSVDVVLVDNAKEFEDMPGHWAEEAVDFVAAREIFNGTSEKLFSPYTEMDRAMMITILARFDGEDTLSGDTWYEKGVDWAKKNDVSDGTNLEREISRQELVTMLYRYAKARGLVQAVEGSKALQGFADAQDVSDWALEAMEWAVSSGLIQGTPQNTVIPQNTASRGEVSTVMYRFCQMVVK